MQSTETDSPTFMPLGASTEIHTAPFAGPHASSSFSAPNSCISGGPPPSAACSGNTTFAAAATPSDRCVFNASTGVIMRTPHVPVYYLQQSPLDLHQHHQLQIRHCLFQQQQLPQENFQDCSPHPSQLDGGHLPGTLHHARNISSSQFYEKHNGNTWMFDEEPPHERPAQLQLRHSEGLRSDTVPQSSGTLASEGSTRQSNGNIRYCTASRIQYGSAAMQDLFLGVQECGSKIESSVDCRANSSVSFDNEHSNTVPISEGTKHSNKRQIISNDAVVCSAAIAVDQHCFVCSATVAMAGSSSSGEADTSTPNQTGSPSSCSSPPPGTQVESLQHRGVLQAVDLNSSTLPVSARSSTQLLAEILRVKISTFSPSITGHQVVCNSSSTDLNEPYKKCKPDPHCKHSTVRLTEPLYSSRKDVGGSEYSRTDALVESRCRSHRVGPAEGVTEPVLDDTASNSTVFSGPSAQEATAVFVCLPCYKLLEKVDILEDLLESTKAIIVKKHADRTASVALARERDAGSSENIAPQGHSLRLKKGRYSKVLKQHEVKEQNITKKNANSDCEINEINYHHNKCTQAVGRDHESVQRASAYEGIADGKALEEEEEDVEDPDYSVTTEYRRKKTTKKVITAAAEVDALLKRDWGPRRHRSTRRNRRRSPTVVTHPADATPLDRRNRRRSPTVVTHPADATPLDRRNRRRSPTVVTHPADATPLDRRNRRRSPTVVTHPADATPLDRRNRRRSPTVVTHPADATPLDRRNRRRSPTVVTHPADATPLEQQCPRCHEVVAMDRFPRHLHEHRLSPCLFCTTFLPAADLKRHLVRSHSAQLTFPCPACSVSSSSYLIHRRHYLQQHVGLRPSRPVTCKVCATRFSSLSAARRHVQTVHLRPSSFSCNECQENFSQKGNLDNHVKRIHRREVKSCACELCGKTFEFPCDVREHVHKVHLSLSNKTAVCDVCGKSFAGHRAVRTHINSVHTKEVKYPCPYCKMVFHSQTNMTSHKRRMHESASRKYKCDVCLKGFCSPSSVNTHKKVVHERLLRYTCDVCNQGFKVQSQLKYHRRKHTGECPYQCPHCCKSFPGPSHISSHMKKVHKTMYIGANQRRKLNLPDDAPPPPIPGIIMSGNEGFQDRGPSPAPSTRDQSLLDRGNERSAIAYIGRNLASSQNGSNDGNNGEGIGGNAASDGVIDATPLHASIITHGATSDVTDHIQPQDAAELPDNVSAAPLIVHAHQLGAVHNQPHHSLLLQPAQQTLQFSTQLHPHLHANPVQHQIEVPSVMNHFVVQHNQLAAMVVGRTAGTVLDPSSSYVASDGGSSSIPCHILQQQGSIVTDQQQQQQQQPPMPMVVRLVPDIRYEAH